VCDTSGATGVCVQCTGTNRTACDTKACNSLTKVCSPFDAGSAGSCQDCVSDDHCAAGNRCLAEIFPPGAGGTNLGFSCFPLAQNGTCAGRPYALAANATSIDGAAVNVCTLRLTTCAGVNNFFAGLPCTADSGCGANLNDAICEPDTDRCSVPCITNVDCPSAPSTCSTAGVCSN
jgi:hypothetical protein